MSKPVLGLIAAAWLLGTLVVSAQDAPKAAMAGAGREFEFKAGSFLTQEDYEHIVEALRCVELKPKDLTFEKKVALNQRFVLPICAQCLDNPLGVPRIAEDAAGDFSAASPAPIRARRAAEVLQRDLKRFEPEELRKEAVGWIIWAEASRKLSEFERRWLLDKGNLKEVKNDAGWKSLKAEVDASWKETISDAMTLMLGAKFEVAAQPAGEEYSALWGTAGLDQFLAQWLYTPLMSLSFDDTGTPPASMAAVAAQLSGVFCDDDIRLPGAAAAVPPGDPFGPASRAAGTGPLVAAARLGPILEGVAQALNLYRGVKNPPLWLAGQPSREQGVHGGILGVVRGPHGRIIIGGTGDNTYEGDDFVAIIDLGGNDTYRGRVASGIGLPGRAPLSFVLDLGGNDRYEGEDFTQGFGFNGVGILWDLGAGNDYYRSRFCSQACGLLGYGELFDDGGDDQYFTDSGSQGAACFGYGHLIDAGGNDTYRGARYVQACALVGGVAVLTDGGGNDLYYAGGKYLHKPLHNDHYQSLSQGFSIGNRSDANPAMGTGGGVALLLDQGDGNDNYIADIYGQGSSYWYSLGMLVDEGGNDNHVLYQYGLGGGIHLSTGILVNLKGNDTYTDPWGVGLGGAHDYAVGWLIDRAGNDLYQGGGQGQGLNFSVGFLLDCAGNDSHACPGAGSIGAGHNNDISLLLDLDGEDFYTVPGVKNGRFTRQGGHGLIYDCPSGGWFPGIDASTLPTKQDPVPKEVIVQHILISCDGCNVPLKNAATRSEAEALALARQVLREARRKGADWSALQKKYNEDSGDGGVHEHNRYLVAPEAALIKEFKDLALTLGVGQIALSAKGPYGWHIIKRVE